jgi:hypothetical protein
MVIQDMFRKYASIHMSSVSAAVGKFMQEREAITRAARPSGPIYNLLISQRTGITREWFPGTPRMPYANMS